MLGPEYFARAGGWELLGLTAAAVTASVLTGGVACVAMGGGLAASVAAGAVGGGVEYLSFIGGAYALSGGASRGPTLGGLATATLGGAAFGGALHGAGLLVGRVGSGVLARSRALVRGGIPRELSRFSRAARNALEGRFEQVAALDLPFRRRITTGVRLSRFFATANRTYPTDTPVLSLLKRLPFADRLRWEQGHTFLQQRWWRADSLTRWRPTNAFADRGLRRLGNAGWNLVPMPRAMNSYLGRHAWMSFGVGVGVGGGTLAGVGATAYYGYRAVVETGGLVSDVWDAWED